MNKHAFAIGAMIAWQVLSALTTPSTPLFPSEPGALKTEFQDVPPKYVVEDGRASGISYEIMKLIERKSGYRFIYEPKLVPLARVSKDLEDCVMDIQFGLQKTPERERIMVFGPRLYTVHMIGVMRKSDPDCVNRLSTLIARSETALTQIGTGAATALKSIPGLIVDDNATSVDMNIQKLLTNRGKILIYHDLTLNYVIAKSPYRDKLRMVELDFEGFAGFTEVGQYLVYSVKVPQRVQDEINHAVKDAERTGELRAITDKYLRD